MMDLSNIETALRQALNQNDTLAAREVFRSLVTPALEAEQGLGPGLTQRASRDPKLRGLIDAVTDQSALPKVSRPLRLSLAAGLLLINDFWDASHEAAQAADDQGEKRFAPYWHGIAHRQEPDPGNASYWFRRVGAHPIFGEFRAEAVLLLESARGHQAVERIVRDSVWNPYAFIELCTNASGPIQQAAARRVQRLEMSLLLDATLDAVLAR